jgi:hypothetical protein
MTTTVVSAGMTPTGADLATILVYESMNANVATELHIWRNTPKVRQLFVHLRLDCNPPTRLRPKAYVASGWIPCGRMLVRSTSASI